jgi:hypothetical protein
VRLVPPALPVLPVLTARSDLPGPKDRKAPPERVVAKVSPDLKAPQALKARRANPARLELTVLTERQEQTVRLALKVYRVQTARTALSVHRVTRGLRVRLGRLVLRVQMVP